MFPETAIGIERKTQYISVTQRPDLGRNAALVRERIIRRDRAVREQTNDLPQIDRHVLRRIKFLPFARGNEQILPIWREGEAMGEMTVARNLRSEEHTSELQSLMRISYAVFCLKKKNNKKPT